MKKRPKILTIAGFDPSGGAGILADIKTFEQNSCDGFAVQTANTIQNEDEFDSVNWIDEEIIFKQSSHLLKKHKFDMIKISLVPSVDFLNRFLKIEGLSSTRIIWDPVLSASAGFDFKQDLTGLNEFLEKIYLVTPNWEEVKILSKNDDALEGAKELSQISKIYLKGGHREDAIGKDMLFEKGEGITFNPKNGNFHPKHGSGCVFSSALTANIAKDYPINKAILRSKRYVERYLASSKNHLGKHKF